MNVINANMDKRGKRRLRLFPTLERVLDDLFLHVGFEAYPFHIGWYNDLVDPKFKLDYPCNTVALVVISGPDTFEKCVLPYIRAQLNTISDYSTSDPLDESMKFIFNAGKRSLENHGFEADIFHDFDLHPNRRPKVLVQTAAHVAGAVEYFHRDRLKMTGTPTWLKECKLGGVAIHPEFGGWFAIRGVIIIKNMILDDRLVIPKPGPTLQASEELVIILLEEFALRWKNHVWRDIIPRAGHCKYSQDFIAYFDTEPSKRWEFLKDNFLST